MNLHTFEHGLALRVGQRRKDRSLSLMQTAYVNVPASVKVTVAIPPHAQAVSIQESAPGQSRMDFQDAMHNTVYCVHYPCNNAEIPIVNDVDGIVLTNISGQGRDYRLLFRLSL